jgi:hypothetical protein
VSDINIVDKQREPGGGGGAGGPPPIGGAGGATGGPLGPPMLNHIQNRLFDFSLSAKTKRKYILGSFP